MNDLEKGFIVLGVLINKIAYAQTSKNKKKTTPKNKKKTYNKHAPFLEKIDYDGFDKLELEELMNETEEYFKIYDICPSTDLKVFAFETLTKYLKSKDYKIRPEEITFYILLGIELGKYFGINNKDNQNMEEDENE